MIVLGTFREDLTKGPVIVRPVEAKTSFYIPNQLYFSPRIAKIVTTSKEVVEPIAPVVAESSKIVQITPKIEKKPQKTAPIVKKVQIVPVKITGSKTDWMKSAGIPESDWQYVDYIISKESGWQVTVWNHSGSGAYGLCQSLPASKMASAGADYMTNPVTQLKWCNNYAKNRYKGWQGAYNFWIARHYW